MDNVQHRDLAQSVVSERPAIGFFDTKQMRRAKKSSDRNLYQWFHISQIPTTKRKYVIINYTTESEDDDEETDSKREDQGQLLRMENCCYSSAKLNQKCRYTEVLYRHFDNDADSLEPVHHLSHSSDSQRLMGSELGQSPWRKRTSFLESQGTESYITTQVSGLANQCFEHASELDSGNGSYLKKELIDNCFSESKYAPDNTFQSICDYVYKPVYGDTKEEVKDFVKRSIYATEKDSRESPELSLVQKQLHQLVAPTAENLNLNPESNQNGPLDLDCIAADQGEGQTSFTELALKEHDVLTGSQQTNGSKSDQKHVHQVQQRDGQNERYRHPKGGDVLFLAPTVIAEEIISEQSHISLPFPKQQHNVTEDLRSEDLSIKNVEKENFPTDVEFLGNNIDQAEKAWARKVTQDIEPNVNQLAKLTVSSQSAKPAEVPVRMSLAEGKCYLSHEAKPGIEVKILHGQREKTGVSDTKWASCRMKVEAQERLEQNFEICGEQINSNIPSEQSNLMARPSFQMSMRPVTVECAKGAANSANSLTSVQRFRNDFSDGQARKFIASDNGKQIQSSPTKQSAGRDREVSSCENGSAETFNGLKKILEKKLDLNYAVLVWKDYYERKRKKVKEKMLQKQSTLAQPAVQTSIESNQHDMVPTNVPEITSSASKSVVSTSSKGPFTDSQTVTEYNANSRRYQDGITLHSTDEVNSTCTPYCREVRDEGGPAEKHKNDFCQSQKIAMSIESGNSLVPPDHSLPKNKDKGRCFSPDSEVSLEFYTPLCSVSPDAKKCSHDVEVKRSVPARRYPHGDMPHSLFEDKKKSSDELVRKPCKREQRLKEQDSRLFTKVSGAPSRILEEGLPSRIPDHGASRIGRCPHRAHNRDFSKGHRDLSAPRSNEREAPKHFIQEALHESKSTSKFKDISITLKPRKQVMSEHCRYPGEKSAHGMKEGRSPSLTKRSTSRKRDGGLTDFRTSNSGAIENAKSGPRHDVCHSNLKWGGGIP